MDRVGQRGQHGVHLESAEQGDRSAAAGAHRYGPLHGVPSHREYYRLGGPGERQDDQVVEERHVGPDTRNDTKELGSRN